MRLKRILVSLVLAITLVLLPVLLPVGSVMAATTADVTITATPEYLAMTNSTANWTLGNVMESSTYWWTPTGVAPAGAFDDAEMNSKVTNTGSVTVDLDIHGHNFTGVTPWALDVDGSPGADNVTIKYGWTGIGDIGSMQFLTLADTNLGGQIAPASANDTDWCMNLLTGTFTSGDAQTGIVTLTISKS